MRVDGAIRRRAREGPKMPMVGRVPLMLLSEGFLEAERLRIVRLPFNFTGHMDMEKIKRIGSFIARGLAMVKETDRLFEMQGNVEFGVGIDDGMGVLVAIRWMESLKGDIIHDDALFPKLVWTYEGSLQSWDV